jgi:prevent-host-death family protein
MGDPVGRPVINLESDIRPVSDFRARASETLQHVRDTGRPVVLTQRGRSVAVLVDVASYQRLLDELEALRDVHMGLADVEAGRVVAHDEARDALLERYRR